MTEPVESLLDVLEQESKTYEDVLEISKNKKSVIIESRIDELESLLKMEQMLILKISKLEAQRMEITREFANNHGFKPDKNITLSEIADEMGKPQGERLMQYRDRISGVLESLKNINEINNRLINNSLEYINFSINMLSSVRNEGNNYENNGNVTEAKKRNFFDVKL